MMNYEQLIESVLADVNAAQASSGQAAIDHLRDAAVKIDMALDLLSKDAK